MDIDVAEDGVSRHTPCNLERADVLHDCWLRYIKGHRPLLQTLYKLFTDCSFVSISHLVWNCVHVCYWKTLFVRGKVTDT